MARNQAHRLKWVITDGGSDPAVFATKAHRLLENEKVIAGIGGILWIHLILNLYPRVFGLYLVLNVVTMIVIGGLGSISGAVIGAVFITGFVEILAPIEEGFSFFGFFEVPRMLGLTALLLAACMILILVMRPKGVMGKREFSLKRLKAATFKKTHQDLV